MRWDRNNPYYVVGLKQPGKLGMNTTYTMSYDMAVGFATGMMYEGRKKSRIYKGQQPNRDDPYQSFLSDNLIQTIPEPE